MWRGSGGGASLISGSARASLARPSTSRLLPMSAPLLRPSMRRPWRQVGATTAVLGFALSTMRATMGPSSSILTATTSKRSAMDHNRKPKMPDLYSPGFVEVEFSELRLARVLRSSAHSLLGHNSDGVHLHQELRMRKTRDERHRDSRRVGLLGPSSLKRSEAGLQRLPLHYI